jgi:pilus assembly protein CpaF
VGECRGAEALDMLQAMNTGHDGSLTTVHANNPRDSLARLENLVMMAGFDLPSSAIRDQIASAVNIIVQQNRLVDGSRKITQISEITGREGPVVLMQDIFVFEQEGFTEDGKIKGRYKATGNIPSFVEELKIKGDLRLDMDVFVPKA